MSTIEQIMSLLNKAHAANENDYIFGRIDKETYNNRLKELHEANLNFINKLMAAYSLKVVKIDKKEPCEAA